MLVTAYRVGDSLQCWWHSLQCWWQLTVLVTTYNVGDNLQTRGVTKTSMSQSVLVATYRLRAWWRPQCHRVCWWQLTDKRCDEDLNVTECVGDNLQTRGAMKTSTSVCVGDNLQTRGVTKTSVSQNVLVTTYRQAVWWRLQCHRVCWWQLTDKRRDEDLNVIECVDGITPLQLKGHSVPCGDKVTLVWLVWCIAVIAFLHTQRQQNCYVLDLVLLEEWLQHSYCTHYIYSNNSAGSTAIAHST